MSLPVHAQFNAHNFDTKFHQQPLHFGITLAYNRADFRVFHAERFLYNDTIRSVESTKRPGFTVGIISNLQVSKNFDLRVLPSFSFAERQLNYQTFQEGDIYTQSIQSINMEIPALVKFKSDPYKDLRAYIIGGAKYSYDLIANANARNAEGLVKLNRHDISIEYGLGLEIYFEMFILAPEIRFSQGLFDVHSLDPDLRYSNVLQKLLTRAITISFHFEG